MITRSCVEKSRLVSGKKRKLELAFGPKMATSKDRVSAKWTEANDLAFIDLCLIEVRKGNRPGTSLSKEGWKNVVKDFHTKTGIPLDQKQLKIRWDQMKRDWSLYRNLVHRSTGLGWDPIKQTIIASDELWEEKITANKAVKKFRNKDMSVIGTKYDELFRETVATGIGAKASTQPSDIDIEEADILFSNTATAANIAAEGSGDSDEIVPPRYGTFPDFPTAPKDPLFPPSPDFTKGNSSGSKRKRSSASSIKEGIQMMLNKVNSMSTETSAYIEPRPRPTIEECMHLLNGLAEVPMYSEFYYFSASLFMKSGNRQLFMSHVDDRARVGWLTFKHAEYERGHGGHWILFLLL